MKIYFNTRKIVFWNALKALTLFFALAVIQSCDKNPTEPVDVYNYYPLQIGKYQIYEVKEEIYSSGQKDPTIKSYQEKDEIERMSTDGQGIPTFIFSRSTRNTSADYWQKVKEYSVTSYPDKILTNIDNQTFFSLIFPVDPTINWNGNIYNNLDEENYHYESINKTLQLNSQTFDKTLTVVERKDTSIIDRYIGIKQYGLGIGLISDDQIAYEYCQNDNCIGQKIIESGSHKTRTIIESGNR